MPRPVGIANNQKVEISGYVKTLPYHRAKGEHPFVRGIRKMKVVKKEDKDW